MVALDEQTTVALPYTVPYTVQVTATVWDLHAIADF